MITELKIKNFKSLKSIEASLNKLNILVGLNGMGKSSFLQVLLLLIQSEKMDKGEIDLNGGLVQIGQGKDALYQFAETDVISIRVSFRDSSIFSWDFGYNPGRDKLKSVHSYSTTGFASFKGLSESFQYISAERIGPKELYESSSSTVEDKHQVGLLGEYSVNFLNRFGSESKVAEVLRHPKSKSPYLVDQVAAWMNEVSPGVILNTRYVAEANKYILDYQFEFGELKTNSFKPKNVGFGISYVLPVIVALLTAPESKTLILENPESHIHPKGQAELGRMIGLASKAGAQILVETHSDHIINGIRVAVREGILDHSDINIMFFSKESTSTEQYSTLTPIKIDPYGELSEYPENFLDEWTNQLLKLI